MIICGQAFSLDILARIAALVEKEPSISRRALSKRICQWLDWRSPNGKLKEMSCRVALKRLEQRGVIRLPKPVFKGSFTRSQPAGECYLEELAPVQTCLADLGELDLVLVGHRQGKTARTWKEMMEREHYLGSGPLCGAQLRYLIKSARFGWLGGLSFSSAAWRVKARDQWIAWDDAARRENLSRIVCNSRFLIRPQVQVPNLASRVLALSMQHLVRDWRTRYGYAPLLVETFVECERFAGTCYRAANWVYAGKTCGRGRQDRHRADQVPVKDVYLYPLHPRFREQLCRATATVTESPAVKPEWDWAQREFSHAEFGDARLTQRLVTLARDFYTKPAATIPQTCGSRASTKAAYRFFDHPQTGLKSLLASHYHATLQRIHAQHTVLAVQGTTRLGNPTQLDTDSSPLISDPISSTLALSTHGLPLGLLETKVSATSEFGHTQGLSDIAALAGVRTSHPRTNVVNVGDCEGGFFALFNFPGQKHERPRLLVRAEPSQLFAEQQGALWKKLQQQAHLGFHLLKLPHRGTDPARKARVTVRFAQVKLQTATPTPGKKAVTLWAVSAREITAPVGAEPLAWLLLTNLEIGNVLQATEKLDWYALQWEIDVYHHILNRTQRATNLLPGKGMETCLAIDRVVAWYTHHLSKLPQPVSGSGCCPLGGEKPGKVLVA